MRFPFWDYKWTIQLFFLSPMKFIMRKLYCLRCSRSSTFHYSGNRNNGNQKRLLSWQHRFDQTMCPVSIHFESSVFYSRPVSLNLHKILLPEFNSDTNLEAGWIAPSELLTVGNKPYDHTAPSQRLWRICLVAFLAHSGASSRLAQRHSEAPERENMPNYRTSENCFTKAQTAQ
jgi:hypothetical protein